MDVQARRVADARAGDAAAFASLIGPSQRAGLRVATVVLGTHEGADDVVQVAVERAWRSLATFEEWRPFEPWFLRIVANCARNDRRARGRQARLRVKVAAALEPRAGTPDDAAIGEEDRRRVTEAMNRLSPPDRLVIALRHFEGMNEQEMAEALHCRPGTVKSRLSRAMARLRAELERTEDGDG